MKHKLTTTLFALLFLLLGAQLHAQNLNSPYFVFTTTPYTVCVGSPVNFTAVDTSGQFTQATHWWDFGDGNWSSGSTVNNTVTNVYTQPGTYTVWFSAWDSLTNLGDSAFFQVVVDSFCPNMDFVGGHAWHDLDNNGVQNGGEPDLAGAMIEINPGNFILTTNQNGDYGVNLPAGAYTIQSLPSAYHTVSFPAGNLHNVTSLGTGQILTGNDFGHYPTPGIQDLRVAVNGGPPVPGFNRSYFLSVNNVGTQAMVGTLTFDIGTGMTFVSAQQGGTHNAGTITWNVPQLLPGQSAYFQCIVNADVALVLGSTVTHLATVNPVATDQTPANNIDTLAQIVVGSYDPNDKQVSPEGDGPGGDIAPGTELEYKVRFQNTGTWFATDVVIRDTLDADLDRTTLEVIGASHPYTWYLNNQELVFEFRNIMLPDSNSNEPASHGWVMYRIEPKSTLPLGTEITNTASIYFDFNAPIVTNTTLNTLADLGTAIDPAAGSKALSIAPHPVTNLAVIRFDNLDQQVHDFVVRDLSGKTVKVIAGINGNDFTFSRSDLPAGLYIYSLTTGNEVVATGKMVVQ